MSDIELRQVQFREDEVSIAVKRRPDGKAIPRAMIAGITAHDLMTVVGAANFYYGNQIDFQRRVDCSHQVAEALEKGEVEIGVVSEIPIPLSEGLGVLLSIPLRGESGDQTLSVLAKISSRLEGAE